MREVVEPQDSVSPSVYGILIRSCRHVEEKVSDPSSIAIEHDQDIIMLNGQGDIISNMRLRSWIWVVGDPTRKTLVSMLFLG